MQPNKKIIMIIMFSLVGIFYQCSENVDSPKDITPHELKSVKK